MGNHPDFPAAGRPRRDTQDLPLIQGIRSRAAALAKWLPNLVHSGTAGDPALNKPGVIRESAAVALRRGPSGGVSGCEGGSIPAAQISDSAVFLRGVNMAGSRVRTTLLEE